LSTAFHLVSQRGITPTMSLRRRLLLLSFLLAVAATFAAALLLPPFIRHQAQRRAQQYHLTLQIQSVRPAWLGLRLGQVDIACPDIPSLTLHAEAIEVRRSSIAVINASATVQTDLRSFAEQVHTWRSRLPSSSESNPAKKSSALVAIDNLALSWQGFDGEGSNCSLTGLNIRDLFGGQSVDVGLVQIEHPQGSLKAEAVALAWIREPSAAIRSLGIGRAYADVSVDHELQGASSKSAAVSASDFRDRLARWASTVWAPMAVGATVRVEALEVLVRHGGQQLHVGPGRLSVQQDKTALLLDLTPRSEGAAGITFRGSLPLSVGPVVLDVVGGPIPLGALGVKEGNLGLVDVASTTLSSNAHLKLHEDGKTLSFDGKVVAKNVGLEHARLAPAPVRGLELAAKLRGVASLDGSMLRFDEGQIDIGAVQFSLRGSLDRGETSAVDIHFGIPLVACQSVLEALPPSLAPVVHGMIAAGTLSLSGYLRWDETDPKKYRFEYKADHDCRFTSVPEQVDVRRFRSVFKRKAYDLQGKPIEVETGPGTAGWVSREGFNHFIEAAVMTCEDGRFRRHRGFDHEAIENSVRENLRAKKMLRGASTISMQLAKNLYLGREKTVSRKLQELILTMYLEQTLTKDQIMELYLNVIEFGPMTYGIGNAASKYFHKHAASLTLGQSMYLASVLPSPLRQHFAKDGKVTDGWMRYLYKLMRIAAKMRWITELELEDGLGEWVVYGTPDPIRMTPMHEDEGEPLDDPSLNPPKDDPFGWQPDGSLVY